MKLAAPFVVGMVLAIASLFVARKVLAAIDDYTPSRGAIDQALALGYAVEASLMSDRRSISLAGLDAIKRHESLVLTPYRDQAGLWTIGYGHLLKSGEWWESITEEQAVRLLAQDVGTAEDAVNSLVKVPLAQEQFDALVSFVYNVGVGAFKRSTMLAKINAGDLSGAAAEFMRWNKVTVDGEKVESNGLSYRRTAEARLFTQGAYA